ncbi:MAG: 6-carboxytetrahydropterin synthase QueD [Thiobacillus sp.]
MDIFRIFHLQCARRLPALPDTHPCSRVHGHSFEVELTVSGEVDAQLGWVCDFTEIEAAWRPIHEALDHRYLNDVARLDNPTSERLAIWLWGQLKPSLPGLSRIRVMETHDSGCIYRGEPPAAAS